MFDLNPLERNRKHLFENFDQLQQHFLDGVFNPSFRTDIKDEGDHYLLEAELPGLQVEDIEIRIENSTMIICAKQVSEQETAVGDEEFIQRERHHGAYCRSFNLKNVNTDAIDASYQQGVLKLILPKYQSTDPPSRILKIREG